ncbi:hypothetical protein CROQUDRAFT_132307 [Cronartium quercuum f. sp. fusiforme G11]|uniref:Uncharacterized protein n=1 Tax=Cronartium quercuum f. sp. fusiforme G11 TaxID=708437 RepID=A0A9P6NPE9_9BASI|nr:hypothetical protein CROQUDRAFT_132307 [Cronartium quercuum f. sp. fusiforme G11]
MRLSLNYKILETFLLLLLTFDYVNTHPIIVKPNTDGVINGVNLSKNVQKGGWRGKDLIIAKELITLPSFQRAVASSYRVPYMLWVTSPERLSVHLHNFQEARTGLETREV